MDGNTVRVDPRSLQRGADAGKTLEPPKMVREPMRPAEIRFYDFTNKTYDEIQQILHGANGKAA